jgi:hypothetical protein
VCPDIKTVEHDINAAVDILNEIIKLDDQLASEEVQQALKIPITYAAAVQSFRAFHVKMSLTSIPVELLLMVRERDGAFCGLSCL